jgi:ABC-type multidrug transport system permease subunit
MTEKNTKKGLPAPESKRSGPPDDEKSAELTGAVVASTIHFAVIFGCAVLLGFLLYLVDTYCPFVPKWMIHVGHGVEYMLFAYDVIGFIFTVSLHFLHHVNDAWKEWKKFRNNGKVDDEK